MQPLGSQFHPELVPLVPVVGRGGSTHLPEPLSSLIGREREIAAVGAMVRDPAVRLVTLVGPGGVGKTRLALAVAAALAPSFADGAVFVALAQITNPDLVLPAVAQEFGIHPSANRPLAEQIASALRLSYRLVVFDNVEQVLDAAPVIAELVVTCPNLTAMVTNRERLRLSGEHVFVVPPLVVISEETAQSDDISRTRSRCQPTAISTRVESEAVRLFAQRAREAFPAYVLTDADVPIVTDICARLDGLPLAIELAAARITLLPPPVLLARLDRRLPLLTGGPRDQPARQRTLRDAIGWSYDLLSPGEQALFRALAVFAGGFTLDAAEAVCGIGIPEPAEGKTGVFDTVESLVSRSLLQAAPREDGSLRFHMLATIREFATEHLERSGDEAAMRDAHAAWMLALAERAAPAMRTPDVTVWLERLAAEHDNLQAALVWLEQAGRWHDLLRLAQASSRFWELRLHLREGRTWLELALEATSAGDAPTRIRAEATRSVGVLALRLGDYAAAETSLEAAQAGWLEIGDTAREADTLRMLGAAAEYQGEDERATTHYREALKRVRAIGHIDSIVPLLDDLSDAAYRQGDYAEAMRLANEAVTAAGDDGNLNSFASALVSLGQAASAVGDWPLAQAMHQKSLRLASDLGGRGGTAEALTGLADVAAATGDGGRAARLLGAVAVLMDENGLSQLPHHALHRRALAGTRSALNDADFAAAWAIGQTLPLDQAVADALDLTWTLDEPDVVGAGDRSTSRTPLSPRETEVLRLVMVGYTDAEIAASLFVSVRTVEHHVANILGKLGVRTRTAAASAAIAQGLAQAEDTSPA